MTQPPRSPFKRFTQPPSRPPSLPAGYGDVPAIPLEVAVTNVARNLLLTTCFASALYVCPSVKTWALGLAGVAVIAVDRERHLPSEVGFGRTSFVAHDLVVHSLDLAAFYAVRRSLYLLPITTLWAAIHLYCAWECDQPTDLVLVRLMATIDPNFLD